MPDPDLLVRTSGEFRISNYLLWQLAYSELVFTDVLWPDFRREHLFDAVAEFQRRDRRFGGVDATGAISERPELRRSTVRRTVTLRVSACRACTGIEGSCCARSSSGRPTGSSRSSPRATARSGRWPRGPQDRRAKFGARLEPTSHVALQCYRGRELDVVTQVETIDANRRAARGLRLLTHAVSMLEAVDQVAQEREPNPALYRMLTGALRTLGDRRSPLVTPAFFWKLLSLEGFHPMLDGCARCGSTTTTATVRPRSTSTRAARCAGRARAAAGRRSTPDALDLLRRILGGGLNGVLAEAAERRRRTRSSGSASGRSSTTSSAASARTRAAL